MKENKIQTEFLKAIDEYIELEKFINSRVRKLTGNVCSGCTSTCCSEKFCKEIAESELLCFIVKREFASRGEKIEPENMKVFLGKKGCMIDAGRYPECTRFICLRIIKKAFDNPYDKIYYYGLSNILSGIAQSFSGGVALHFVPLNNLIKKQRVEKLQRRLKDAHEIIEELETFKKLIDAPEKNQDNKLISEYLFRLWQRFPFAAKSMYAINT